MKISVKLVNGSRLTRKFSENNTVRQVYAIVAATVPDAALRRFELLTSYPSATLSDKLDLTLKEAGIGGSQLMMRWAS